MTKEETKTERPPVVAVMGHIDHGKSTLLDYIRKSNVAEKESGGITQHLGAYEVIHKDKEAKEHKITFLDTPGHEAFRGIRERGADVADIAILVVSGEDGVKPQTLEALECIKKTKTPFLVAITKIDKPQASIERTKQSLAEHEIYVEGYGGDIPCSPISSKTGEGIPDLLDYVLLLAALNPPHSSSTTGAKGFIIEADISRTAGIAATLILKDGWLKKGSFVVSELAYAPARRLENFLGKQIDAAASGTPVRIFGWNILPRVGAAFVAVKTRREAESMIETKKGETKKGGGKALAKSETGQESLEIPLIIKADSGGSLEALEHEIRARATPEVRFKVIHQGLGPISEGDLKVAQGAKDAIILGFHVGIDAPAKGLSERSSIPLFIDDVIYTLSKRLTETVAARKPKVMERRVTGSAKILKLFKTEKDKHIIGGKVLEGEIRIGDEFTLFRRDSEIGNGRIRELQRFKEKTVVAAKDSEFGALISSSIAVAPGDKIEIFSLVEK